MRRRPGPVRDRLVPRLSGHLETLRPYDLAVIALTSAAGAALASPSPDPAAQGAAIAAGSAACAAALYAADYLTRAEDMLAKPERPIPSGRLSTRVALSAAALASAATIVIACLVNVRTLLFVGAAAGSSYAYGRWLKDRGLWGDLANGFAGWSCTLLAGACLAVSWPPAGLVMASVALGLQGTFSNLLLAVHDYPSDLRVGCRTVPVRHGPARAGALLGLLSAATYAAAALTPLWTGRRPTTGFVVFVVGALVLACATLTAASSRRAIARHLLERLLLPGALLALAGRTGAAVVFTALAALVVAVTPRPMLEGGFESGFESGFEARDELLPDGPLAPEMGSES